MRAPPRPTPAARLVAIPFLCFAGLAVAGCGPLPTVPPLPFGYDFPAETAAAAPTAEPGGGEDRTVLLGLALRQEMIPDRIRDRGPFCHVDLVVGDRIVGFFNTSARPRGLRSLITAEYTGAFREWDWLAENRPYYVDADAARAARVNGRPLVIVTTWIATRITPAEAEGIREAVDARRDQTAPYRLFERNCASRVADILVDGGWLPAPASRDGDSLAGLDRPVLLAREFTERAGADRVGMARGWFTTTPDGAVRIDALAAPCDRRP